jgi:dihydrofolate reductase
MMNHYNKLVFSHTITATGWNNAAVVKGDIVVQINDLKKKQGRDIMVYGSGSLVDTLIKFKLVDEFQLWMHPVILGSGRRLFKNLQERIPVEMVSSQSFASGVVMLQYRALDTNGNRKKTPLRKYNETTLSKTSLAKIAGIE